MEEKDEEVCRQLALKYGMSRVTGFVRLKSGETMPTSWQCEPCDLKPEEIEKLPLKVFLPSMGGVAEPFLLGRK